MAVPGRPDQIVPQITKVAPSDYKTVMDDHLRPATPEMASRSSFSSIRENDSDLAQTFTLSKVSSYSVANETAVEDSPALPPNAMIETQLRPPVTQPHSKLHRHWYPADGFNGWKEIGVRGKPASRSFGDLQILNLAWTNWSTPVKRHGACVPGDAPIEHLPIELLGKSLST